LKLIEVNANCSVKLSISASWVNTHSPVRIDNIGGLAGKVPSHNNTRKTRGFKNCVA